MKHRNFFMAIVFITAGNLGWKQDALAQSTDWRNVKNGNLISTNGYCDQPYVVVLKNGKWLCVFTTGESGEGSGGQHIVSCISGDQGKTWTIPIAIEKPGKESTSWAMPYLTKYGRVYVFYDYNGDKIHELNGKDKIREDMLGWYCYKYSDNEGRTWSQRFRLNVRKTKVDFDNDWKGKVQMLWGIGKPVDVDRGMMFSFAKIGNYLINNTEGWFFKCENINTEKAPEKLDWSMLPDGDEGLKNGKLGLINEEQNIFQMNNGSLYCMERTVSGHPAESYSNDGGKTWTMPRVPKYLNGIEIKNPRACPRIWKCKNGKYLFWYHNNGGWDFSSRNPAWISGGIEKNGKIIWGQPEILLYEKDVSKLMSYPDLIEADGKYWITETNKEEARCNEIPANFMNKIWSQPKIKSVTTKDLVNEWKEESLSPKSTIEVSESDYHKGFTADFRLELADLSPGQIIFSSANNEGKSVVLKTGEYGSVEITLNDGIDSSKWNSDPGLIPAVGVHCVSVIVDNGPKIIQFIIDGKVCNGRNFRQFGWSRFNANMDDFKFSKIEVGDLKWGQIGSKGKLTMLRIYNRPLMNTEIIGNHQNFMK